MPDNMHSPTQTAAVKMGGKKKDCFSSRISGCMWGEGIWLSIFKLGFTVRSQIIANEINISASSLPT